MEAVFPARLRRASGESPMGAGPHGRLTGVSPGPHRCLTGPPCRTRRRQELRSLTSPAPARRSPQSLLRQGSAITLLSAYETLPPLRSARPAAHDLLRLTGPGSNRHQLLPDHGLELGTQRPSRAAEDARVRLDRRGVRRPGHARCLPGCRAEGDCLGRAHVRLRLGQRG